MKLWYNCNLPYNCSQFPGLDVFYCICWGTFLYPVGVAQNDGPQQAEPLQKITADSHPENET